MTSCPRVAFPLPASTLWLHNQSQISTPFYHREEVGVAEGEEEEEAASEEIMEKIRARRIELCNEQTTMLLTPG